MTASYDTPLSHFSHVISNVLRHLPLRDVCRLARVNRIWRRCGEKVLKRRLLVEFTVFRKLEPNRAVSVVDSPEVNEFMETLHSKPRWAFVFGQISRNDLLSLKRRLPGDTEVIGQIASAGVIGTTPDCRKSREFQRPKQGAFSALLIPDDPSLEVFTFGFTQSRLTREIRGLDAAAVANSPEMFSSLFNVPYGKHVKLLLLVSPSYIQFGHVNTIFRVFSLKESGQLAFAGGVVEEVWRATNGRGNVEDLGLTGIAFCGDNIRAASVVIPEGTTGKEEMSAVLRKLAATGIGAASRSFAFMYACCGRGKRLHKREDVEVAMFRQFFPNTPIQGVFSMGECGADGCSVEDNLKAENDDSSLPTSVVDTTFAYSTVITVVAM